MVKLMNRKINWLGFMPFMVFIGLVAIFAFGMWGNRISRDASPLIGKPAPIIEMIGLDNQTLSLGGKSTKPIIINFFASWCAPCRAENAALLQLAQSEKIELIGIAYRDDPPKTTDFLETLGNPFAQIGIDRQGEYGAKFGLSGVPETYIIDTNGIIIYKHKGEVAVSDIPKLINIATQK